MFSERGGLAMVGEADLGFGMEEPTQQTAARRRGVLGFVPLCQTLEPPCARRGSPSPLKAVGDVRVTRVRSGSLSGSLDGLTIVSGDTAWRAGRQTPKCLLGVRTRPRGRL